LLVYGGLLLLVMMFSPQGLHGIVMSLLTRWRGVTRAA
jgi:ABC-type branched-subunit amino acid transport system permease subunit